MQLFPSQQLRQKQSLVITAQLQQAIRLLQMSNIELAGFLDSQSEENPFLEVSAGEVDYVAPQADPREAAPEASDTIDADMQVGALPDDGPSGEMAEANTFETGQVDLGGSGKARSTDGDDWDMIASSVAGPEASLYGHACAQIDVLFAEPIDRMIALAMSEALEPTGWLGRTVVELSQDLLVEEAKVEAVLVRLQTIDPAGLFARDLAECLRLQAIDRDMYTPAFAILLDNLPRLAKGEMKPLAKMCGVDADDLREMLRDLRRLDPKPGTQFSGAGDPVNPPDLIVRRGPEGWVIDLNRSTLPSVKVNRGYAEKILALKTDVAAKAFTQERVAEAGWLRRAIAQRNATTLKIGAEIVRQQQGFLDFGLGHLRPLVLRDVADAVGVHESTVSRVTSGLMMATPQGTFRLKAFFSVGLSGTATDGGEAASAIKFKIRKLIESEPIDAPYSDDVLVKLIAKDGVKLARRTAAKYREMQNIPSSFDRRRQSVMAGQA